MKKIIQKLRKHPEHVKVKILYGAMLVSSFLLFGAWIFMISANPTTPSQKIAIKQSLKPFSMLKSSIIDSTNKLSWPFGKKAEDTPTTNSSGLVPVTSSSEGQNNIQYNNTTIQGDSHNTIDTKDSMKSGNTNDINSNNINQ